MSFLTVLAQRDPGETTSSAAAAVFGVFILIGVLSVIGVTSRGRRTIMPLVAVLLGASIVATTISEAKMNRISPITFLGLFFGGLVAIGGFGALREGIAVPTVEGHDPEVPPQAPRITPDEH